MERALHCLSSPFRLILHNKLHFSFDPFRCSDLQPTVEFAMFHHSEQPFWTLTTAPVAPRRGHGEVLVGRRAVRLSRLG